MNIFKERMKWIVSILISFAIVGVFIYCVIFAKDTALSLRKLKKNDIYSYVEINGMPLVAQVENVYKWKDRYHRLLREDDLVIGDAIDLTYNRKIVFEPEIVKFFEENEINLETMPEDDEILKNGTVDFVSISYYSSNCVSVTQKGEITAANGGENIKNPYLETSAWGWQIDVLLVQKSH